MSFSGCVFLKAPSRGLAAATRDDGAILNRLLASYEALQEVEQDDLQSVEELCSETTSELISENYSSELGNEQMADELDDGKIISSCFFLVLHRNNLVKLFIFCI